MLVLTRVTKHASTARLCRREAPSLQTRILSAHPALNAAASASFRVCAERDVHIKQIYKADNVN